MLLERAPEFIDEEELVEVTPKAIRLRKTHLAESDHKKASRDARSVRPSTTPDERIASARRRNAVAFLARRSAVPRLMLLCRSFS